MSPSTNNFILRKNKFKLCGLNWTPLCLLARQINNCLVKVFLLCFLWWWFLCLKSFYGPLVLFYELLLPSGKFQLWSSVSLLWPFDCWSQEPVLARLMPMTGKHTEILHIQYRETVKWSLIASALHKKEGHGPVHNKSQHEKK